ncbi:MAG: PPC domain-containing protein [Armatimonadota bacterium]
MDWPAQTQAILPAVTRIVIRVTGPGIATPVEAVIERPNNSVTFDVPAGDNRVFRLSGRNAAGQEIQLRERVVERLEANSNVALTVELYDVRDPADNTQAGATEIGTGGQTVCGHVLDRQAPGEAADDWLDWYRFSAQAGRAYEIRTLEVSSSGPHALAVYQGDTQLAVDDAPANQGATLNWTAPAAGTYYLKVWLTQEGSHMLYCVKVTAGSEAGGLAHVSLTVR